MAPYSRSGRTVLGRHFFAGCGETPEIPTKKSQCTACFLCDGVDVVVRMLESWIPRTLGLHFTGQVIPVNSKSVGQKMSIQRIFSVYTGAL